MTDVFTWEDLMWSEKSAKTETLKKHSEDTKK